MECRYDAVIIGGGPAGALAALHLARLGWHTALLERGMSFRSKACGHCLNPRAWPILKRAGVLEQVRQIGRGDTHALRLHLDNRIVEVPMQSEFGTGVLVSRSDFDQLLRDVAAAAGADVRHSATARLRRTTDGISLEVHGQCEAHRLSAPLFIGADGLGSGVARAAGLVRHATIGRKFGFAFGSRDHSYNSLRYGAIEMFIDRGGYLGAVMEGDSTAHLAGLVSSSSRSAAHRHPMAFVRRFTARYHELRSLDLHHVIESASHSRLMAAGPMPWRPERISHEHVALIGDAAGYIEPFTGEGMTWAMQSAELLADVLHEHRPGTWNRALAARYAQHWRDNVQRGQRWCRILGHMLERHLTARWAVRAAARWPALAQRLAQQVIAA